MVFKKIIHLAKADGWKAQTCGVIGINGSSGINFYKDGKVLSISIVQKGQTVTRRFAAVPLSAEYPEFILL